MAILLPKESGDIRVISDDLGALALDSEATNLAIKMAATTCYQTRESSQRPPPDMVKYLKGRKHFAMTEFSWVAVEIKTPPGKRREVVAGILLSNSLLCVTEREDSILVSGNGRVFNEAFPKLKDPYIGTILTRLAEVNDILYNMPPAGSFDPVDPSLITFSPELLTPYETLVHRAAIVEFNNCSRGVTHETVRSRNGDCKNTSYAQESTRYVDYAKGGDDEIDLDKFQIKIVLPYRDVKLGEQFPVRVGDQVVYLTIQEIADMYESVYRSLRKAGWKAEQARQFLPIGLTSQIVQMYNLLEWYHWFIIRCGPAAHPEIRFVAVKLLREFQRRIPGIFDDFAFGIKDKEGEDGTEYATSPLDY